MVNKPSFKRIYFKNDQIDLSNLLDLVVSKYGALYNIERFLK